MQTSALACSCIVVTANDIAEKLGNIEKIPTDIESIEKLLIEADTILNTALAKLHEPVEPFIIKIQG